MSLKKIALMILILSSYISCEKSTSIYNYKLKSYTIDFSNITDFKSSIKSLKYLNTNDRFGLENFLIFEDRFKKILYFFDKSNYKFIKKLNLIDMNSNQVQFVSSIDSHFNYFVLYNNDIDYSLLKIQGSEVLKYEYKNNLLFYPANYTNKELNWINDSQFLAFNWLKIAKYPYALYHKDYNSTPIFGYYSIRNSGLLAYDSSIGVQPIFPISNSINYVDYFPRFTLRLKKDLYFQYACSDSMYRINLLNGNLNRGRIVGNYPYSPIALDSIAQYHSKTKYDSIAKIQVSSTGIYYDRFRDLLYRIILQPNSKIEDQTKYDLIIQIISPNLELLNEFLLPRGYRPEYINSDGIHFLVNNDFKNKRKTYEIYNFLP